MGLDQLGAAFEAHKVPVLATAAAGVAALALYKKRTAGAAAPAPAGSGASTGGQTAGMNGAGYYDSSASDVYGLVQPQLESLGQQIGNLSDKLDKVPVTPAPATKPTPVATKPTTSKPAPTPTPAKPTFADAYYRVAGYNLTYHQAANGTLDWVSKAEGDAAGIRKGEKNAGSITNIAKTSPFWQNRTYVGGGPVPTKLK